MSDLEAILRREAGVEEPKEEAVEAESKEVETEEVEEAQAEQPKAEEPKKAEAPPPGDDAKVPIRAMLDEREKRQQYERELKELREAQEKAKANAPDFPDYFEDPKAYNAAVKKLVEEQVTSVRAEMQQQFSAQWLAMSERAAKARYQDFDDKLAAFSEEAKSNPVLAAQMLQAPDPGEYVYQTGKKLLALSSTPDLESLERQIEERVRAKIAQEEAAKREKLSSVPKSLTKEQSAAGPRQPEWQPADVGEILNRRRG